jgi:hypothetical protein
MKHKYYPPSWIPNTVGFRFIGKWKDGTETPCEVVKDDFGLHVIKQGSVSMLENWRNMTADEKDKN